jgi:hypothetical protein
MRAHYIKQEWETFERQESDRCVGLSYGPTFLSAKGAKCRSHSLPTGALPQDHYISRFWGSKSVL